MFLSKPSGFYLGGFLFALEDDQRMRTVAHWCILFRIRMTLDNQLVTVRNNIEQSMVISAQNTFFTGEWCETTSVAGTVADPILKK
jgi:hypothetical protein